MQDQQTKFIEVGTGEARRRIAYRYSPPAISGGPGVMWLIGLKSDMGSTKATALADWAAGQGIGCVRFDYSGHGQSSGRFEDAVVGDWLEEAAEVFKRVTAGPQVVVGSSTGGHIALLLLRKLMREDAEEAARLKGLVLVAPAWDLTELIWGEFSDEAKREVMEKGSYTLPNDYDAAGYVITRRFIEEGRNHLLRREPFDPGRPVAILQGLLDTDVPPAHARALATILTGGQTTITEVPDAGHSLSRPEDLARLFGLIERVLAK